MNECTHLGEDDWASLPGEHASVLHLVDYERGEGLHLTLSMKLIITIVLYYMKFSLYLQIK